MSMNFAFGFSLILLLLIMLNLYFFYSLNTVDKRPKHHNYVKSELQPIIKEIYDYLNYLPKRYKTKNAKCYSVQKNLISSFSSNNDNIQGVWDYVDKVNNYNLTNL